MVIIDQSTWLIGWFIIISSQTIQSFWDEFASRLSQKPAALFLQIRSPKDIEQEWNNHALIRFIRSAANRTKLTLANLKSAPCGKERSSCTPSPKAIILALNFPAK